MCAQRRLVGRWCVFVLGGSRGPTSQANNFGKVNFLSPVPADDAKTPAKSIAAVVSLVVKWACVCSTFHAGSTELPPYILCTV